MDQHTLVRQRRALSKVGVPVTVVLDFDILNDGAKLKELVEGLGGAWTSIDREVNIVRTAINNQRPVQISFRVLA